VGRVKDLRPPAEILVQDKSLTAAEPLVEERERRLRGLLICIMPLPLSYIDQLSIIPPSPPHSSVTVLTSPVAVV